MPGGAYAGDVSSSGAWRVREAAVSAVLVEVGAASERRSVSIPEPRVLGKDSVFIPLQEYPAMARNGTFVTQQREARVPTGVPMLCNCDSVVWSDVAGEVAGGLDRSGRGSRIVGWKVAGLPLVQE